MMQIHFPGKFVFGDGCLQEFIKYFLGLPFKRPYLVADPGVKAPLEQLCHSLKNGGVDLVVCTSVNREPTEGDLIDMLAHSEAEHVDAIIGIGGGSVLDMAKLIAAMFGSGKHPEAFYGTGKLRERKLFLACLPTTAGTGSEMSPNSILLSEQEELKKAVISPFLVPDATFVDPVLTHSVPPAVTASTGIDALTHCIEVYANRFSHPITDLWALEGIRMIYHFLERAFQDGSDAEARRNVALGSVYGGLGLGPVNTAAVHALAYPLGSRYQIPHGVSNAVLLPQVLESNLHFGVEKYAKIARAVGVEDCLSDMEAAQEGIGKIKDLCGKVQIPSRLSDFNIPVEVVPSLARSAITVQRLLKNNLRDLSFQDIEQIYYRLF